MENSIKNVPRDHNRVAIWAQFVKAIEEHDFDTTRALFDAGKLGQEHIWEEFEMARDCTQQISCLQRLGSDYIARTSPRDLHSIEDFKAAQARGLDLRRTGHLYLQDFANRPEVLDYLLSQGSDVTRTDCRREYNGRNVIPGRIDTSLHLLDQVAALGDVNLFNKLVSLGADPLKSEALHRASKCHDEAKSVAMISCLIDRHNMSMEVKLHAAYTNGLDTGPERGTPLCSAIYNRNLPVAAELLRRSKKDDLWSAIVTAMGGSRVQYNEPALHLLLDHGGLDLQKVLDEAIHCDNLRAATVSLEHGADAAFVLREQLQQNELALAQELNPPAYKDREYYREMSEEMKALLEERADKTLKASIEASRL